MGERGGTTLMYYINFYFRASKFISSMWHVLFPCLKTYLHRQGRKLTLEEFWNEELSLLPRRKMEEKEEKEEQDVLEMEEVMLVTHMVESNMAPSIKIPLPPPPHPSSLRRRWFWPCLVFSVSNMPPSIKIPGFSLWLLKTPFRLKLLKVPMSLFPNF